MKVLIISYNPLSLSNNGGKRFCGLFSSFSEDELMQFYISPVLPDKKRCSSYYQVTDSQIIKFKGIGSNHIVNEFSEQDSQVSGIYSNSFKNRSFKLLCRDVAWKFLPWYGKDLKNWIEDGKPDCIFADTGDSCFLYKIALKISRKYNLPLVCSFGDDYYSLPYNYSRPIETIQRFILKRQIKKFINNCNYVITINDKIADYYSSKFGTREKFIPIYMGATLDFKNSKIDHDRNDSSLLFSFIGNQNLGRWENLIEFAQVLDLYNSQNSTNHCLHVYGKNCKEFIEQADGIKSLKLRGVVPGEEVKRIMLESDILIHTESFRNEFISQTRFSLSSKIPDCLMSGKPLLAYGPECVASMEYLLGNNCAFCIISEAELKEKLFNILDSPSLLDCYIVKGRLIGKQHHNALSNSIFCKSLLIQVMELQKRGNYR